MCLYPGRLCTLVVPGHLHVVGLGDRWRPAAEVWEVLVLPVRAVILEILGWIFMLFHLSLSNPILPSETGTLSTYVGLGFSCRSPVPTGHGKTDPGR